MEFGNPVPSKESQLDEMEAFSLHCSASCIDLLRLQQIKSAIMLSGTMEILGNGPSGVLLLFQVHSIVSSLECPRSTRRAHEICSFIRLESSSSAYMHSNYNLRGIFESSISPAISFNGA